MNTYTAPAVLMVGDIIVHKLTGLVPTAEWKLSMELLFVDATTPL